MYDDIFIWEIDSEESEDEQREPLYLDWEDDDEQDR